jgi:hypothetical protein
VDCIVVVNKVVFFVVLFSHVLSMPLQSSHRCATTPRSVDEDVALDYLSYAKSCDKGHYEYSCRASIWDFIDAIHNVHSARKDLSRRNQLYSAELSSKLWTAAYEANDDLGSLDAMCLAKK